MPDWFRSVSQHRTESVSTRSCSSSTTRTVAATIVLGLAFLMAACGGERLPGASAAELQTKTVQQEPANAADTRAQDTTGDGPANATDSPVADKDPRPFQDLAAADILNLNQRWTGDYDELAERRFLRVLVPYSRTLYYLDGPEQKGIAYESLRELESQLPLIGGSKVRPKIVIIPTTRDRLLAALAEGYGDVAIGAFTVTDLRRETVEFSAPTMSGIENVVVTGKDAPAVLSESDLAGREIHVQRASSYYEDLVALNERLTNAGAHPVSIMEVDARLEDEDVLQMVDAGIIPATVSKRPVAEFWAQLYDRLVVHSQVALRSNGQIAWALRKDTPQVKKIIDDFVVKHRAGTLFGNILLRRYLGGVRRLKNPTTAAETREISRNGTVFPQLRRPVRFRLDPCGCAGLPGIAARPFEAQPGRRGGCNADQAHYRSGSQRRHRQRGRP